MQSEVSVSRMAKYGKNGGTKYIGVDVNLISSVLAWHSGTGIS